MRQNAFSSSSLKADRNALSNGGLVGSSEKYFIGKLVNKNAELKENAKYWLFGSLKLPAFV